MGGESGVVRGPSPGSAVRRELARAVLGLAAAPLRAFDYLVCSGAARDEVRGLLDAEPPVEEPAVDVASITAPPRLFVSCAERSGELHAVNLVRAVERRLAAGGAPPAAWSGLGGEALAAAGVRTIGDPVANATMGFDGVLRAVPFYVRLLERAAAELRDARPDALVAVDSPALHVPLGRIAHRYGVPVVHFVTPQYWGWAPWRVGGYARAVDRALTILPFEPEWFARRGVDVTHVGHPLLDELEGVPGGSDEGSDLLAVLPGSRRSVVDRNLPWMLGVVKQLRERVPTLRVVLPHGDAAMRGVLEEHVSAAGAAGFCSVAIGDLHGALARVRAAFSVSGTVLLDLLHHRLPTVVLYRLAGAREAWMARHLLTTPWFSSVNLLAGREVYPEFAFHGAGPAGEVCAALEACYNDPSTRRRCRDGLELAARRLGPPGATDRAAAAVLATARGRP